MKVTYTYKRRQSNGQFLIFPKSSLSLTEKKEEITKITHDSHPLFCFAAHVGNNDKLYLHVF